MMLLSWEEQVVKPYVTQTPDSIIPILFLNSNQCHMMGYLSGQMLWMDERVMLLLWVEQVLKPYVTEAPDSVIPTLFLKSYQMVSVVESIQELGHSKQNTSLEGCTGLLMPVC